MRPIIKVIGVAMLALLGCAWAWGAAFATTGPGVDVWEQGVCSDYNIPCSDSRASGCLRCRQARSTSTLEPAATPTPVVVSGGGTYGPGGVKRDTDGNFRPGSPEEINRLEQEIEALIREMPNPTVERDRMLAEIFGKNGFVFDQVQLLQNAANHGGLVLHPEDTVTIMQLYEQLELPEVAVDYSTWATDQLPAYEITTPFGSQYYFDYWAQDRVEIFKEAKTFLDLTTDMPHYQEQVMAFDEAISEIEQQLDESQFTGMVLIPTDQ